MDFSVLNAKGDCKAMGVLILGSNDNFTIYTHVKCHISHPKYTYTMSIYQSYLNKAGTKIKSLFSSIILCIFFPSTGCPSAWELVEGTLLNRLAHSAHDLYGT